MCTLGGSFWCNDNTQHRQPTTATPLMPAWKNKSAAVMKPLILTNVIAYIINFFEEGVFTQEGCLPAAWPRFQSWTEGRLEITIWDATSQCKPTEVCQESRKLITPPLPPLAPTPDREFTLRCWSNGQDAVSGKLVVFFCTRGTSAPGRKMLLEKTDFTLGEEEKKNWCDFSKRNRGLISQSKADQECATVSFGTALLCILWTCERVVLLN